MAPHLPMTDTAMIQHTAAVLFSPGTITELRMLGTQKGTVSGYFDNAQDFTQAASQWSGHAPAVYALLNPCLPALLARAHNRLKFYAKTTTNDTEIVQRYWLPLDFDPVRPADISSTDAEHAEALARAQACTAWLTARGWPAPVAADSGNGAHRLYRIDLPNDDASRTLLQHCLEALAMYFSDSVVKLDVGVFNAARIWKIYGTMACKGDSLPERPHRLAQLLDVPASLVCVSPQDLQDLAALLPPPSAAPPPRQGRRTSGAFDLRQWLAAHSVPVAFEGAWQQSGYKWVLHPCPWNSAHTNKSAFVLQFASGAIAAGCHHNGCQGNDWHALRDLYEPGWQAPPPRPGSANGTTPQQQPPGQASSAQPTTGTQNWRKLLLTYKNDEAKQSFTNMLLCLEHLAPWETDCWYDVVADRTMLGTSPLEERHVFAAARAIEQASEMAITNLALVAKALRSHCGEHRRDVLQEWLGALPPWDGVPRLTEYLVDHAGVAKTVYPMAAGRLLLVSMVARALQPGIQCRSVIIFEGPQDIGKSRLVKLLAGEEWYREVSGTLEGKEAHMLMKGTWLVELSEMDVMLRTEESRVKAFITMCNDEYVPKYANDPVKLARRTVLVGTINPEGDGSYLRDQTGATRYYPIPVGTIALDDIAACREQLFAEALVWFNDHPDTWWQMPTEAQEELKETREARRKEGTYEGPRLHEWLAQVEKGTAAVDAPFHTEDALRFCFNIPPERWTASTKDQVGKAIGKAGWYVKNSRARGPVQRLWHRKV